DNASGTAAELGLARAFAAAGGAPRTLVFVTFAGEEMGLLGSAHYVRHPALPLDRTVLMVNLDMVGRLRNDKVFVGGADSAKELRQVLDDAARGLGLTLQLRGDPFSPSDHTSFYAAGRPVLFLFTGAHGDYHRPTDTWEKINAPGLASVATLAMRVVSAVAREATPPAYVRIEAPVRGQGGGYGPFFGVIPDFGDADRPGVKITGVRAGSPAEQAGVRAGDIIEKFADADAVREIEAADVGRASSQRQEPLGAAPGDVVFAVERRVGIEAPVHAGASPDTEAVGRVCVRIEGPRDVIGVGHDEGRPEQKVRLERRQIAER